MDDDELDVPALLDEIKKVATPGQYLMVLRGADAMLREWLDELSRDD